MKKILLLLLITVSFFSCDKKEDELPSIKLKAGQKLADVISNPSEIVNLIIEGVGLTEDDFHFMRDRMEILSSLDISKTKTLAISEYAFFSHYSLRSIKLPECLKRIGNESFTACSSLESMVIPANVTYVGLSAFNSCVSMVSFTCLAIEPPYMANSSGQFLFATAVTEIYVPLEGFQDYKSTHYGWKQKADILRPIPN